MKKVSGNTGGSRIPLAPKGKEIIKWLGPGFLWMVSAAGSGELLFTPRIGSLYGYSLLWALVTAVSLKWFINREIGRYTVCTGQTVIDGFANIPGPRNWALYVILIPQLFVAVTSIAGLAASGATALILVFPGNIAWWTIGSIIISTVLVVWGRFKLVERIATILAILLSVAAIVSAVKVFKDGESLVKGFVPVIPGDLNYSELLPWLGFMLSGAAGMMWYSYWIQKKGYGAAKAKSAITPSELTREEKKGLKRWIGLMTIDNTVAVAGTFIVTIAFLVLGTELLRPKGLVPEQDKVAEVLGQLLGDVWGPAGFWFMVVGLFIGFWDTVLSDQDGFGRLFSGGFRLLLKKSKLKRRWLNEEFLRKFFVIVVVTVFPSILYLFAGEPVSLLKAAGAIEAAHIPVLVVLILYLNNRDLPRELRPSTGITIATALAGLFFAAFAVFYLLQVIGVMSAEK